MHRDNEGHAGGAPCVDSGECGPCLALRLVRIACRCHQPVRCMHVQDRVESALGTCLHDSRDLLEILDVDGGKSVSRPGRLQEPVVRVVDEPREREHDHGGGMARGPKRAGRVPRRGCGARRIGPGRLDRRGDCAAEIGRNATLDRGLGRRQGRGQCLERAGASERTVAARRRGSRVHGPDPDRLTVAGDHGRVQGRTSRGGRRPPAPGGQQRAKRPCNPARRPVLEPGPQLADGGSPDDSGGGCQGVGGHSGESTAPSRSGRRRGRCYPSGHARPCPRAARRLVRGAQSR